MPKRNIDWPAAAVAIAFIVLVLGISVAAINKYSAVADALQWWGGLSGFIGLLTGAAGAYFFTRGEVNTADQHRQQEKTRADGEKARADTERGLAKDRGDAINAILGDLEPAKVETLRQAHPAIRKIL